MAVATPGKSSGPYGEFPTAAAACAQISEQATGATLLPLSADQGKTAELEQAKTELARTADMVPDSIKADFARLSEVAVAGVKDQSVFSSGKLQDAMAPVTGWLAAASRYRPAGASHRAFWYSKNDLHCVIRRVSPEF